MKLLILYRDTAVNLELLFQNMFKTLLELKYHPNNTI